MSEPGRPKRVVFLGTPEFAVPSLNALIASPDIEVPLVITQPDRRAGRGKSLKSPPVKDTAEEHNLPVLQPASLRDESILAEILSTEPDVLVVVSFGEILRRDILEVAPAGCLNVHPSLLPAYRGSIPVPATILNGDPVGGVSFIKLVRQMDAGPIVHQFPVELNGTETAGELLDRLGHIAADELPGVVVKWINGDIEAREQDHQLATYTRELRKSDAQIDWTASAREIERFVRAMHPWPRAWSIVAGQRISIEQVTAVHLDDAPGEPGTLTVDDDQRPLVETGDGRLQIDLLTPAGKKQISGTDWLRGARHLLEKRFELPGERPQPLIFKR
jgi:methionyl-tRNA formyltransferase